MRVRLRPDVEEDFRSIQLQLKSSPRLKRRRWGVTEKNVFCCVLAILYISFEAGIVRNHPFLAQGDVLCFTINP